MMNQLHTLTTVSIIVENFCGTGCFTSTSTLRCCALGCALLAVSQPCWLACRRGSRGFFYQGGPLAVQLRETSAIRGRVPQIWSHCVTFHTLHLRIAPADSGDKQCPVATCLLQSLHNEHCVRHCNSHSRLVSTLAGKCAVFLPPPKQHTHTHTPWSCSRLLLLAHLHARTPPHLSLHTCFRLGACREG